MDDARTPGNMDGIEKSEMTERPAGNFSGEESGDRDSMGEWKWFDPMDRRKKRIFNIIGPLIVALISIFVVARFATAVSFYSNTIESLDQKKETVMQLTAVSTGASAAITLIPGDVATPIADKLADLSSYFIIVLCAIYLEKYLLTITGYAAFIILIPLGCVMLSIHALRPSPGLVQLAKKLILFGIAIVLVIPSSVGVSNLIEKTHSESINMTVNNAMQTGEDTTESLTESGELDESGTVSGKITSGNASGTVNDTAEEDADSGEKKNWLQNLFSDATETVTSTVQGALDSTVNGVETKIEQFKTMLNNMMEALAVMIVTSCLIPIIVLIFFVWLIKVILNVNMPIPPIGRPGMVNRRP